jgi:hypothetical protein
VIGLDVPWIIIINIHFPSWQEDAEQKGKKRKGLL